MSERERERKRDINVREKHRLTVSRPRPDRESNLQPMYVPQLGIEPVTIFWLIGWYSNQLSHLTKAMPGANLTTVNTAVNMANFLFTCYRAFFQN